MIVKIKQFSKFMLIFRKFIVCVIIIEGIKLTLKLVIEVVKDSLFIWNY